MTEGLINALAIVAVLIIIGLLIKEGVDHANTKADLDEALYQIDELHITLDRYYKDKKKAQAIADHAITVIQEAQEIARHTIHEARVNELARAFIDRRQREQDAQDLQNEIDKLIGGNS